MKSLFTTHRKFLWMGLAALTIAPPAVVRAATDIDISANYTSSWEGEFGGDTIIAAPINGSDNTGITFADWSGYYVNVGYDQGGHGSPFTINFSAPLPTAPCVNALINLFYGVSQQVNGTVVFTNDQGATASFSLVGDETARDYNVNQFTNSILGYDPDPTSGEVYTQEWWSNYTGSAAYDQGQRLDVTTFILPAAWAGTNLVGMSITNLYAEDVTTSDIILSALQVSTVPSSALPVVTVAAAGAGEAVVGGAAGKFVLERTGNTGLPLTIYYRTKGSAKAGVEYKPLSGSVIIPAGASKIKVKVKPLSSAEQGTTSVKLILKAADGSYNMGTTTRAKIKVVSGD